MEEKLKNGGECTAGVLKPYSYFCTQESLLAGFRVPEIEIRSVIYYCKCVNPWTISLDQERDSLNVFLISLGILQK